MHYESIDRPVAGNVYLNAPLEIGLFTEPKAGSAKDTFAVLVGCGVSTNKALLLSTHVSAWESRSR